MTAVEAIQNLQPQFPELDEDGKIPSEYVGDIEVSLESIDLPQNAVIVGDSDGKAEAVAVAASRILARLASGETKPITVAELKTLLALTAGDISGLIQGIGKVYTTTDHVTTPSIVLANCANTALEITVFTLTIPANTWLDGEAVTLFMILLHKNNSGGAINITQKIKVNADSYTSMSAVSIANNATEGKTDRGVWLRRIGTSVYLRLSGAFGGTGGTTINNATFTTDQFAGTSGNVYTSVNFAADIVITITMQWASQNAAAYFNPLFGLAWKI